MKKSILTGLFLVAALIGTAQENLLEKNQWSREKAHEWYARQKWITGANFNPSTAINQLEMWQKDTFDPKTIDRELGYAEGIGFNTMRVYLHSLAYKVDPEGFKKDGMPYRKDEVALIKKLNAEGKSGQWALAVGSAYPLNSL